MQVYLLSSLHPHITALNTVSEAAKIVLVRKGRREATYERRTGVFWQIGKMCTRSVSLWLVAILTLYIPSFLQPRYIYPIQTYFMTYREGMRK